MTKAQHTPGPWEVQWTHRDSLGLYGFHVFPEGNPQLGTIADIPDEFNYDEKQKQANARLIAAAPELLEALKTMLLRADMHSRSEVAEAFAAIAKATGN